MSLISKDLKIFQIGFQKVASTSFYELFKRNGIPSIHFCKDDPRGEMNTNNYPLSRQLKYRYTQGEPILMDYPEYNVFCDFGIGPIDDGIANLMATHQPKRYLQYDVLHSNEYGNIRWFQILDKQYPSSIYILNTRDVDQWIVSRKNWESLLVDAKRKMVYKYPNEYPYYNHVSDQIICDLWKQDWHKHIEIARKYFRNYDKFLEYDIDSHHHEELAYFLQQRCGLSIDLEHWGKFNESIIS
eukprot:142477_1